MKHILSCLILLFAATQTWASGPALGLFNSPRGFGGIMCFPASGDQAVTRSLTLYADIYGMPSGREDTPGIKFNFTNNHHIFMLQSDQVDLHLYAGPGMSIGYVHDSKKGNTGHIAALSGSISCTADFGRRITLNLGFSTEFGLHLRRDENFDIINLALYKNGLIQSFYPQLSILFRL